MQKPKPNIIRGSQKTLKKKPQTFQMLHVRCFTTEALKGWSRDSEALSGGPQSQNYFDNKTFFCLFSSLPLIVYSGVF